MLRNPLPLDYLASSPVRGQLEPYDPKTPQDWRWLQTTETLDQFRVLLPPSTARAYERLLACESEELEKQQPLWERVLEIRHLKDRMIRKTQRLSPTMPPRRLGKGESFAFQAIIAPEDFRLKEMERWLHEQALVPKHTSANVHRRRSTQTITNKPSLCCLNCGSVTQTSPPSTTAFPVPPPPTFRHAPEHTATITLDLRESEGEYFSRSLPRRHNPSLATLPSPPPDRSRSRSPSPLPLRLRNSSHSLAHEGLTQRPFTASPETSSPEDDTLDPLMRPKLSRRRSILKRSSISEMVKTVSWADSGALAEQIAAGAISQEAAAGISQLEPVRVAYQEQMETLDFFEKTVLTSLEKLRLDVTRLEEVEATLGEQKLNLSGAFEAFEAKRIKFREQVHNALEKPAAGEAEAESEVQETNVDDNKDSS